jgi:hypothetical protein
MTGRLNKGGFGWRLAIPVFVLGLVLFGQTIGGLYGVGLWLPQMVQAMGVSKEATGFIVAIPYLVGVRPWFCGDVRATSEEIASGTLQSRFC